MSEPWTYAAALYVAGVTWGLLVIDARTRVRIGLALLWPLGPIAFVVTLAVLLVAAMIAFPLFGAVLVVAGVALYSVWASV